MNPAPRQNIEQIETLYWRPGFLLRRAHQLSDGIFEETCKGPGLTPAQYAAMSVLGCADGIDQSTLARALGYDRVTTLRIIRGLEQRGLVLRRAALVHRRRLSLSLTGRGRDLLELASDPARRAIDRQMQPLATEEQAELLRLLRKT